MNSQTYNTQTYNTQDVHADMLDKAQALLRIIEEEQDVEDINEDPESRAMRFQLKVAARRLVARMIKDIRASERRQSQAGVVAMAA